MVETKAPTNYFGSVSGDGVENYPLYTHDFTIAKTSNTSEVITQNFSATNTPYPKGVVELTKVDATDKTKYLDGATFTVYQWTGSSYDEAHPVDTLVYDSSRHIYKSQTQLAYSATNKGKFKIVETKAPTDYFGSNNDFNVAGPGQLVWEITVKHQEPKQTVYTYTYPGSGTSSEPAKNLHYPYGQVTVTKKDSVTKLSGARQAGATFKLYEYNGGSADPKNVANYHEWAGTSGSILTDNNNGTYTSAVFQYNPTNQGKFLIKEIQAPFEYFGSVDGDDPENKYRIDTQEKLIFIDLKNDNSGNNFSKGLTVNQYSFERENTPYPKAIITIRKTDTITSEPLDQAVFHVWEYDKNKGDNPDNINFYTRKDQLVDNHDGTYTTPNWLIYSANNLGHFIIKETEPPYYYVDSGQSIKLTLTEPGEHTYTYQTSNPLGIPNLNLKNDPWKVKIRADKIDSETGNQLPGAIFKVYEYDVSTQSYKTEEYKVNGQGEPVRLTYQEDGTYVSSDWLYANRKNDGKFRIIEDVTPSGYYGDYSDPATYTKRNNDIQITADKHGKTLTISNNTNNKYNNVRVKGTITVYNIYHKEMQL